MKHAFDKDANFSAMAEEPLFISKVEQKSYVDVDEQGTEAAAVTTVTMMAASLPMRPPDRFEMIVDRPFLFVITDNATDSILFIGIVNDPTATGAN
jgi:serpin B